jgi:hypothetical protein
MRARLPGIYVLKMAPETGISLHRGSVENHEVVEGTFTGNSVS